jgi:hypothetical protein
MSELQKITKDDFQGHNIFCMTKDCTSIAEYLIEITHLVFAAKVTVPYCKSCFELFKIIIKGE